MTEIGSVLVILICGALTARRLPSAMKGQNVEIFAAGVALTVAFTLINPAVYAWIGGIVGNGNIHDPVSKIALFIAFAILGSKLAQAAGATRAKIWIVGRPGRRILVLFCAAIVALFFLIRTDHSSPALVDFSDQPATIIYTGVTLLYLVYVTCWVLAPLIRSAKGHKPPLERISSVFLVLGLLFVLGDIAALGVSTAAHLPFAEPVLITADVAAVSAVVGLGFARLERRRIQRIKQAEFLA